MSRLTERGSIPSRRAPRAWGAFALLLASALVSAQTIDFEFEEADLRTVIKAVAEFTGRNFLVDPNVKGTVTMVSPRPLDPDQAYQAFLAILDTHGFLAIERDGVTRIVAEDEGKTLPATAPADDHATRPADLITRVIALQYVSAERLMPVLRPLVATYGHLAADAGSRTLLITDRAANVARIVDLARSIDRPANTGEVVTYTLRHAGAAQLAPLLNQIYQSPSPDAIALNPVVVLADTRSNSLIIRADPATRGHVIASAIELDQPAELSGDTHVVYLKNADAANVVEVLQKMLGQGGEGGKPANGIALTADPDTNAVIVTAPRSDFASLGNVIEQLDVRRLQVHVEALIAEVVTDNRRELGVQWQTADGLRSDQRGVIGGTNFTVGTSIRDVILNPLTAGSGLSLGYADGTIRLADGTEVTNLSVLARALNTESNVNVLSTPNILTLDNQSAEIVIGQNVPFVTGSYSQTNQGTGVSNPFQTIQREDVGLTLRIKPQITEGGSLKLEIFQEVSSVAKKGEAADIVTNTRSLTTTIVAEDNHMLVLGGLIQEDRTKSVQKVPLLGDIPVLGHAFRYKDSGRVKTNLLIFLRPRIMRGAADLDAPTQRKYEYLGRLLETGGYLNSGDRPDPIEHWEMIGPSATAPAAPEDPAP